MSVSGLAEGFLAGFNTMDNYQRGQKADERAEREMSLRDAMFKQNTANSNRDFSLRQAYLDNQVAQQKVTNDQWGQEFDLKRKEADSLRAYRNDNLVLAQAAERRAKESHALAVAKNKRDQWWLDNEVPFNMATAALGRGEQITPEQDALLNHEYAAGRNPYRVFGDPQWHRSSDTVYQGMKAIINNPDARAWDMGKLHKAINTSEVTQALTYMVKGDLEKGIGTVTPTGVVKSYGEVEVVPTDRGTFFLQAPVTYINPKTGEETVKDAPITEGRTGDPSDPVKEFTPQRLIQYFGKARQVSQQIQQNPEQWENFLVQTGVNPPADYKGLKAALADLHKQEAKALADGGDPATVKAAFDEARESLPSVYGVNTGGTPGAAPSGVNPEQWSQSNPERQQFMREAEQGGWLGSYLESPEKMDGAFALWRQAVAKEEAAKQAAVSAEKVRNMEGGKNKPHNYRAAEEAAVNTVIAPFTNGQPTLNKAPDGAAAYQAMSLAQARK
ncbi:hypothetical protein UXA24_11515 [Aeromonas caviae]|uniref:hypothetical protein n=1 Tax=Aeromonas TaxID=642 RepID=UPI001B3342D7|nr:MULTISPECIES: hypothetical protein [Aeromonas]MBP4059629.1 hypothetical protein [Aeromonas sp. Prich7-2]MDY7841597.1 hypothetical protein [Aeromonas caviae]